MEQTGINQQRFIYTAAEAAEQLGGQPYIAHVCYSDWTDGDHSTLMHCHEDIAEVLLILEGRGDYTVDLRRYQVAAGDVILCSSGALHDEFPRAGEPYRTLCIGIGALALPGLPAGCLIESRFSPVFRRPEQFDDLRQMFCQIDRYAAEREDGYQRLCQYLMLASLELIRRMARGREAAPEAPEEAIFRQVARYIDRHYAEDVSIERLVRAFYISPYHLSHMFKQKTGYTVKQYLLRRRLGEAQIRLASTQDSVQTIAEELGFEDASYFSRIFSKYIGLTPTEYRKYRTRDCGPQTRPAKRHRRGGRTPPAQIWPFQNGRGGDMIGSANRERTGGAPWRETREKRSGSCGRDSSAPASAARCTSPAAWGLTPSMS